MVEMLEHKFALNITPFWKPTNIAVKEYFFEGLSPQGRKKKREGITQNILGPEKKSKQ